MPWVPSGTTTTQVLPKRRQISVGGSLRARSPDPAQLSWLRKPGAQDPSGPQASQATQTGACEGETMSHRLQPRQTGHLMRRADSFEKTLMLGKSEGRRRRDDRG